MTVLIRIAHLSSTHAANDIRILFRECASLKRAGYEVCLVVPEDRNYSIEGVDIVAVPRPKNRLERIFFTTFVILGTAFCLKADLYHIHDPDLLPAGLLLRMMGKGVVYDVHENFPKDILSKKYIPTLLRFPLSKCVRGLEWLAGKCFSFISAATPGIAKRFPEENTALIQNFPLVSEFPQREASEYSKLPNQIAYIGLITEQRGIEETLDAVEKVHESIPDVSLALMGKFYPSTLLVEMQKKTGWRHVTYREWSPRPEVRQLLAGSRIGLVLFRNAPNHVDCQPNKLFEYMAVGIPIVATDFPNWREIINKNRCGLLVPPSDSKTIAEAMQWLLNHPAEAQEMGSRGRLAMETQFNWNREAEKLLAHYQLALPGLSLGRSVLKQA